MMTVNFRWNNAEYCPCAGHPILCMTNNDKLLTFSNKRRKDWSWENENKSWKRLVEKYNIRYWVYQNALIDNKDYNGYWDD